MKKRTIALLLACVLIFGAAVGGTIAWLTAESNTVTNTFTVGDINIELKEHDYLPEKEELDMDTEVEKNVDYLFVPGDTLPKDPFVRIKANSENCYVFMKVVAQNNTVTTATGDLTIINYEVDKTVWKEVPDHAGYWYAVVSKDAANPQTLNILNEKQVTVNEDITKDMVSGINAANPTLSFKAAAVQKDNVDDVTKAWDKLPADFITNP